MGSAKEETQRESRSAKVIATQIILFRFFIFATPLILHACRCAGIQNVTLGYDERDKRNYHKQYACRTAPIPVLLIEIEVIAEIPDEYLSFLL